MDSDNLGDMDSINIIFSKIFWGEPCCDQILTAFEPSVCDFPLF